ncbi:MAG: inositol monophosphatase [Clostridia bacterium]|nr:inositol monophosphatase [Clostridia bacterium]
MYSRITELMERCGEIVVSASSANDINDKITVKSGDANYVTYYDVKVQEMLISGLSEILPEAKYIAEESWSDTEEISMDGYTFIIDPIDGTTNFIKDYGHSGISVALAYNSEIVFGAAYNPYTHQMYTAKRGCGARLNGKLITMDNGNLTDGIVAFGTTPYNRQRTHATLMLVEEFLKTSMDIRRSGSAVLDLCDVAAKRSNLFFELQLMPWDYAAASLIVTEAGGIVTTMDNTALLFNKPCSVLAGTQNAHRQALEVLKTVNYKI